MKIMYRSLFATLFFSMALVPCFSQDTTPKKPEKKSQPELKKEESAQSGLRKITNRSHISDFDINIDHKALEANIEAAVEKAMKSVEGSLEKLEINFEPIEINLAGLNLDIEPIIVNIPNINIDIEPIEVDIPEIEIEPIDIDLDNVNMNHLNFDSDDDDGDNDQEKDEEDVFISKEKYDSVFNEQKQKEKLKNKSDAKEKSDQKEKAKGLKKLN